MAYTTKDNKTEKKKPPKKRGLQGYERHNTYINKSYKTVLLGVITSA